MDGFQARSRLIGTELWPLFCDTAGFVKRSDRAPIQIALRIKTQYAGIKTIVPNGVRFECT